MQHTFMEPAHKRLQKARELARYDDATDAARALGKPIQTYLAHENGHRGFKRVADQYARFFKVDLDWLVTGKGEARPSSIDAEMRAMAPEDQAEIRRYVEYIKARASMRRTG